jgi:hypothetical protein
MRAALRAASDPGAAPLRRRRRWWPIALVGAVLAGALSLGGMCWRGRGHERSPDEVVAAVPPVLDAVAAPVDASIEEPPVADAAVAVIDARVDAPPELARRRLPAKQCACIPTDSARMGESTTSSLCGSRQSPSCRCVEDGEGYGLCVEPWAPCDAAGCPEGQDKLDDVYCPRSRSRGAQGEACTGFRNPTAPLASGTFECACPDSAHFYRGQPGDACRGFDGVSGRARRGKLTDCE